MRQTRPPQNRPWIWCNDGIRHIDTKFLFCAMLLISHPTPLAPTPPSPCRIRVYRFACMRHSPWGAGALIRGRDNMPCICPTAITHSHHRRQSGGDSPHSYAPPCGAPWWGSHHRPGGGCCSFVHADIKKTGRPERPANRKDCISYRSAVG